MDSKDLMEADLFTSLNQLYVENGDDISVVDAAIYNITRDNGNEAIMLPWVEFVRRCAYRVTPMDRVLTPEMQATIMYKRWVNYFEARNELLAAPDEHYTQYMKESSRTVKASYSPFGLMTGLSGVSTRKLEKSSTSKELLGLLNEFACQSHESGIPNSAVFHYFRNSPVSRLSHNANMAIFPKPEDKLTVIRESAHQLIRSEGYSDSLIRYEMVVLNREVTHAAIDYALFRATANGQLSGVAFLLRSMWAAGVFKNIIGMLASGKYDKYSKLEKRPKAPERRVSTSVTRLNYENLRMREFINRKIISREAVTEEDFSGLIAEMRPESDVLLKHFCDSLRRKFDIRIKLSEAIKINQAAAEKKIIGCMNSGAYIKLVHVNHKEVYALLTQDATGELCITSAYRLEDISQYGKFIEEMTPAEKELFGV